MLVETMAAAGNLMGKMSDRQKRFEKVWSYLDQEHALFSSIRNCSRFLPENITFNKKCDMMIASELSKIKKYDWKMLQEITNRVHTMAKKRPENFRNYFTSVALLDAIDIMTAEFWRLKAGFVIRH